MATVDDGNDPSARRAQDPPPTGMKGILENGKTSAIAAFAALGGFLHGYNQGMFGQILTMPSFIDRIEPYYSGSAGVQQGLLTAILELGAWIGTLVNGWLADAVGRRKTFVIACVVFTVGVIVQACTQNKDYVLAGRFVTGIGVGAFSVLVPLYNAELAPPEVRGALVALQQLANTFGIMVSYWIRYGTNFIRGTDQGQSDAAWLIPICIQLLPSTILASGMLIFMPESPRHLMNEGRERKCSETLARLRSTTTDDIGVRIEFLEIKAARDFERRRLARDFPDYQGDNFKSKFMIGWNEYKSLITNKSLYKRTRVAVFLMVFQQWSGINAILYYAPFIFQGFGLSGSTISLLATGVVGIVMFLATIPAVHYVDRFGRKAILIAGGFCMAFSHFGVASLIITYNHDWPKNRAAGWFAAGFVWFYAFGFGCSWGPVAWIIISEVFPLGLRAKGVSIGGSSNWLNNFAVAMSTSLFIASSQSGAFMFFGCVTLIGVFWVIFKVPETTGRTLEQMDELFSGRGVAEADQTLNERIRDEIGLTALRNEENTTDSAVVPSNQVDPNSDPDAIEMIPS
ncbi:putative MFS monosaccharide transporter [Polyplosphaeria fusca]|uniref:MFS monosaccharide transporter n=1 Tax=Polyplosphaeria fusca TaxID=682080 RepID=A0A9P4QPI1_9PLEO|nr:putative MFS monosaccharide transporter [Polyplosphaeria fusca]